MGLSLVGRALVSGGWNREQTLERWLPSVPHRAKGFAEAAGQQFRLGDSGKTPAGGVFSPGADVVVSAQRARVAAWETGLVRHRKC